MITRLADIKRFGGINLEDTTDDDILYDIQKKVENWVQDVYCERQFESQTFTEYYDGDSGSVLLLNNYPITSITSIHDDTDRVYGSSSLIASSDYVFYASSGIVKLDGLTFQTGLKNIKVVYVAGYTAVLMPDDLKLAIAKIIIADYITAKGQVNAFSSGGMESKPEVLTKEALTILDGYKRMRGQV